MEKSKKIVHSSIAYLPQEEMLDVELGEDKLFIGIPKEVSSLEDRIPLTPQAVNVLVSNGHDVAIEHNAGKGAHFYDSDYVDAGARIVPNKKEIFKAEIIIKSGPIREEEIPLMKPEQTIISPIQLPKLKRTLLEKLMKKRVTALAFEYLNDDAASYPIVHSMNEISGSASVLIAGQYLCNSELGKGTLLGGISGVPPTRVVIIGAGVVGEYAARTALSLGSSVKVFDNNIYMLERLQNNIGLHLYTSVINPHILEEQLLEADVAIGALSTASGRTPIVVSEEMVEQMKPGSIIVDVSIDRGGCFETSEPTTQDDPVFTKYDVVHYCVPNIPSSYARTASIAISNVLMPILLHAADNGGFEREIWSKRGVREGVYLYNGSLTNYSLSEILHLKFTDLELLRAAKE